MATTEVVSLNAPHQPLPLAIEAFQVVESEIKHAVVKSRRDWDKHEPRMWSRAAGITDEELTAFDVADDLVEVRSGPTSYGTIIFGKIRIPAIRDEEGAGYIHVRIHDPPNRGTEDVRFHSLFTDEGGRTPGGNPTTWRAIQTLDTPLEFFHE